MGFALSPFMHKFALSPFMQIPCTLSPFYETETVRYHPPCITIQTLLVSSVLYTHPYTTPHHTHTHIHIHIHTYTHTHIHHTHTHASTHTHAHTLANKHTQTLALYKGVISHASKHPAGPVPFLHVNCIVCE